MGDLVNEADLQGQKRIGAILHQGMRAITADVGIGENVLSVATDSSSRSLFAATGDGLWVHRLQSLPAPPVYQDAALYVRWLGIGAVGLVATVLAILALVVALPPRRRRT
jgi:hypothetical protein